MDNTLDPIRPSTSSSGDLTYMHARDPSILAYSQRPIPVTKQNLISLFEDEECSGIDEQTCSTEIDAASGIQTLKVYLRMKPFPRKMKLSKEETEAYRVTDSTTLLTKLPCLDHTTSSAHSSRMAVVRNFTFNQTFGPETRQSELFEQIVQQRLVDFLAGRNATVMTYGTTNSGKSYTLQGTTTSPGIIPRGLEFVFSNINTRSTPSYKPSHSSDVVSLSPVDRAQELEAKNKLLTFASVDKHAYINAYKQMQKLLQEESPIRPSQACDAQYSVWVSFAEIYNENIYDLLSNDSQKRRPLLKLGTDKHGEAFIKGLRTVCVNSGSEAYQVLMAGQYNLKVAATALNARSSRSHCIFTIKLLKYYVENIPNSVEVSTFSFCDLAGSERLKKTLNVGERLKEAQNINTSLLVLGRCLKSIYEGQSVKHRTEHVGPFRESKLTRLFQRALSGREEIVLIVNVNPIPNLYVETQNVLNFAAIAKKIVIEPKKMKRKLSHSRFSQIVAQSIKSSTDWNDTELTNVVEESDVAEDVESSLFVHQDEYDELADENKSLKKQISALKSQMFAQDLQTRQELADMYTAMMKKMENDWKNRMKNVEEEQEDYLEWNLNRVENFYKDKLSEVTSRKRRRSTIDDDDEDDPGQNLTELEVENSKLSAKIQSLKNKVKKLRDENEAVAAEKNKFAFDLGLAKDELKSVKHLLSAAQHDLVGDENDLAYVNTLKDELSAKQDRIKKLKEFLDDAKNEYIRITSEAAEMESILKNKDEIIMDSQERVTDLEELLEQVNICLAKTTKEKDHLEERVSHQSTELQEAAEREKELRARILRLENLPHRLAMDQPNSSSPAKTDSTPTNEDSMLSGGNIKEEPLSESDDNVSDDSPETSPHPGIVIKTDEYENLGNAAASDLDNRESEMYLEVREISSSANNSARTESLENNQDELRDTEAENVILKAKLAESLAEIETLKDSLEMMKNQCEEITRKLDEFRAARDAVVEMRSAKSSELSSPGKIELGAAVGLTESGSRNAVAEVDSILPIDSDADRANRIAEISGDLEKSRNQLEDLRIKYDELLTKYNDKVALAEKLEEETKTLQAAHDAWKDKCIEANARVDEIREANAATTSKFESDLATAIGEKEAADRALIEAKELLESLKHRMDKSREDLSKELEAAQEREESYAEMAMKSAAERTQLERTCQQQKKDLEAKIDEITKSFDRCTIEKDKLQEKFSANVAEIESLKKRLDEAEKKEQEKDNEIKQLQKEIKTRLGSEIHEKNMQKDLKKALKQLNDTSEKLRQTEESYASFKSETQRETNESESRIAILEQKIKDAESSSADMRMHIAELERLRRENAELILSIDQKEQEMESFKKNRDETNAKWENLNKTQQEGLERSANEIKRLQELLHASRVPTTPRNKDAKAEDDLLKIPIPVVTLSDSDSKRSTRRAALLPPAAGPTAEPKRTTRKKRLYAAPDDTCIDLESCDEIPPTPPAQPSSTRSLRTRKRQT